MNPNEARTFMITNLKTEILHIWNGPRKRARGKNREAMDCQIAGYRYELHQYLTMEVTA